MKSISFHYKQGHILRLLNTAYNYLGFQPRANDTRLDIYNRVNILNLACKYGHKECIESAKKEFAKLQGTMYK